MRRLLLSALSVSLSCGLFAQQHFGNEWINYGAQYWSFPIVQEGLFRIDSASLAAAGFPLDQVDPRTIQVFGREKQVPIYVSGDSDGVFNAADYIEFYAKGNDAWLDSAMYDNPAHIANPYYSLISDSIQYFITWNAAPETLRVKLDTNNVFSGAPSTYSSFTSVYSVPGKYRSGKVSSIFASTSTIGEGEGYFENIGLFNDGTINANNSHTFPVSTPLPLGGSGPVQVDVVEAGINHPGGEGTNTIDHHVRVYAGQFNQLGVDDSFPGYQLNKYHFTIPQFHLTDPTTNVKLFVVHDLPLIADQPAYPDRQATAFCRIKYLRDITNFSNLYNLDLDLIDAPGDPPAHLHFTFYPGTPVIYAWGDTLRRIMPVLNGSYWDAMVPADPAHDTTHIFITRLDMVVPIAAITKVNGTGLFRDFAATEVDSAMVIVTHPTLMNAALQYAAYRQGPITNHYNTIVANVLELYQQFGGGIPRHPLAIRRLMGYLLAHFATKPKALFLIGKGITTAKISNQTGARVYPGDASGLQQLLVPTFGYPPSDALFTLGLSGDSTDFTVPVGRLAAHTEQDVLNYLAKVQTFETQPVAEWMKNILHFRGGFTDSDFLQFGAYLAEFKATAEDTCFMGHVTTFVKVDQGVIEQASADSVYNLIHEGVTLMTFFAHASGGGFDITIDNPNEYQWNGHYPMIIGNSCYTGNIHLNDNSSASEVFTLPSGAGSIAFLSSVDLGVSGYLYEYTSAFYKSFSQLNYGKSIGEHMRHAISYILNAISSEEIDVRCTAETFTLQGDPTLILNSPSVPDFEITNADLRTNPDPVTVDADSFQVQARIRNIGCGCHVGHFPVAVGRTLQDGTVMDTIQMHSMQAWQDTVVFNLPTVNSQGAGAGLNHLQVRVDEDPNLVTEIEEHNNNEAILDMLITSGDLLPVYPYEYAITPDAAPMLKACTGNPFAPPRTYIFQIDTTDTFNSPMMEQSTFTAPGGVVQWQPLSIYSLNNTIDSLVFFWRCTLDSVGNGGVYNWHEFSFQHITNREGWGQAHYFQFKKDDYTHNVTYDRPQRDFDFLNGPRNIGCQMTGDNVNLTRWTKDLQTQEGQGCGNTPAFHVGVVDPFDFHTWETNYGHANPGHSFGNWNDTIPHCRPRPEKYFIFQENSTSQLTGMADMLLNRIPDGSYILVYTYRYLDLDGILAHYPAILGALNSLGADSLNYPNMPDSVPYIFFCQKGNLAIQHEVWGLSRTSQISSSDYVTINAHAGTILAPYAGPTYEWKALYWDERSPHATDSTRIILTGIDTNGVELPLANYPASQDSALFDSLDAIQQYPYLRVSGEYFDSTSTNPKPAQMRRWQLLESPVPECAIDPPLGYYTSMDGLFEGQIAHVMVAVHNISDYPMDSVLMTAVVVKESNQRDTVHYVHKAPLPAGGVLLDTISFNLAGMAGGNTIIIEANGVDTLTHRYDQLEQYHFNNIATMRFLTMRDQENPMLDVTFDGMHIIDGDIVSAQPEIQITLNDENQTLLLDSPSDTVNFKVFLTTPAGGENILRFHASAGEYLHFVPANGPDNVSKIFYHPKFDQDGTYTIRVQARDLSQNASGDHDYIARFEVINKPTITEVLNYPNPFTTSTRFVFTLTGHEEPTAMRIQIMTIGGRVVREIAMSELGALRIGRNITDYAWDGRDQFGDQLARGVYLYHVIAQLHGEDIEYRETSAGGYFTKGFGKMYLLK